LWTAIGAGEEQIAHGAGDASVSIIERMQREEPQMRQPGLEEHRSTGATDATRGLASASRPRR
jgi:hypothetical protein